MSVFDDNITTSIPTRDALQTALNIIVSKCADYVRNAYPNKTAKEAFGYSDLMDAIEIVVFQRKLSEELEAQHGLLEAIHPRIQVYRFEGVEQCLPDIKKIRVEFSVYVPTGKFDSIPGVRGIERIEEQDHYIISVKARIYNQ